MIQYRSIVVVRRRSRSRENGAAATAQDPAAF
jgi:hypothetical protein